MSNSALTEVKKLEVGNISDIPAMLRDLANQIESGQMSGVTQIAWVADCAGGIGTGLFGAAANPAAEAHMLFAFGQRSLIDDALTP